MVLFSHTVKIHYLLTNIFLSATHSKEIAFQYVSTKYQLHDPWDYIPMVDHGNNGHNKNVLVFFHTAAHCGKS